VPGYEVSTFFGVGAPRNTPAEIIDKLNKEINAGLADPMIKTRFADRAARSGSRAEFGKLIAEDTEKWAKVIRAANIKLKPTRNLLADRNSITSRSANPASR
jgi:tripartite-type tricarboxylate transporter receptor subunit TctC